MIKEKKLIPKIILSILIILTVILIAGSASAWKR